MFAAVAMIACFVMFVGCGGKSRNDSASTEAAPAETSTADPAAAIETTFVVETPCGNLTYPETWKEQLQTEISETEVGCDASFFTTIGGQQFRLFTVRIGGEDNSAGTLTAADGTVRNVSLDVPDLGDISALSQNDQDQLYAMQEGLNVVVENLG